MAAEASLYEAGPDLYLAMGPGRNDIGFADWMKMDLRYIDNWSLWLDFKILFQTVRAVFLGEGR